MSPLHHLIHGIKLTEFLIEGHNPEARYKLATKDVDFLREHMKTGESLLAFLAGRIVGSGSGIWALTENQFLICNCALQGVVSIGIKDIDHFEAIQGRYGHTVRIFTKCHKYSMYGTDNELCALLHQSLKVFGINSTFEDKPPFSKTWLTYSSLPFSTEDCFTDVRMRLAAL